MSRSDDERAVTAGTRHEAADTVSTREIYDERSAAGARATRAGDFEAALQAYEQAVRCAEQLDDGSLRDRAAINVSMVHLQMGQARRGEDGLRAILLRSRDARLVFAAAYNLASALRKQGRLDKAAVYAARALDRATALALPEFMAPAHNLLANIHLNRNELDLAVAEYRTALDLLGVGALTDPFLRAIVLDNLGYCRLLQHHIDEGLSLIRQALSLVLDTGDSRCQAECYQDLCYGLLMRGDDIQALAEGRRSLAIAQERHFADIVENCHYLLGELGRRTGDIEMQERHFGILQRQHPELPFLKDFLCAVDVMDLITLKR